MLAWTPLADIFRTMSERGVAVTFAAELNQAAAEISSMDGPLLIELILDPATVPRLHLWPDWTEWRARYARWMVLKVD